jgi:uncharacterized membrane protein
MGFWDSLLGEKKAGEVSVEGRPGTTNPFAVSLSYLPLRLSASSSNSINLVVKVKNVSPDAQLVSVDALLPRQAMLGFDRPCINKGIEKRLGEIKAGEATEVQIPIWANSQTKEGKYDIEVTVYSHYIGYNKVLSYVKKKSSFRAV